LTVVHLNWAETPATLPDCTPAEHDDALRCRINLEETFSEVVLKITKDCALSPESLSVLEHQRTLALYFSRFVLDASGSDLYSKLLTALSSSGLLQDSVFGSLKKQC
jgi:hypothetical protein